MHFLSNNSFLSQYDVRVERSVGSLFTTTLKATVGEGNHLWASDCSGSNQIKGSGRYKQQLLKIGGRGCVPMTSVSVSVINQRSGFKLYLEDHMHILTVTYSDTHLVD